MDTPTLTKLEYFTYDPSVLRDARVALDRTIQELADEMEVNYKTIERIEKGRAGSYETAAKYCRFVGLNPLLVISPVEAPAGKRRGARKKIS